MEALTARTVCFIATTEAEDVKQPSVTYQKILDFCESEPHASTPEGILLYEEDRALVVFSTEANISHISVKKGKDLRWTSEDGKTTVLVDLNSSIPSPQQMEHLERCMKRPGVQLDGATYMLVPEAASTPKKVTDYLRQQAAAFSKLDLGDLQQLTQILTEELHARQPGPGTPKSPFQFPVTEHDMTTNIISNLVKGALRTTVPRLSNYSGDMTGKAGEVSFEQWSFEVQGLRKTSSESAIREGMNRSLKGPAADTVRNMGPEATLDEILKKLSINYGVVISFDALMGNFFKADMLTSETVPLYANRIESLMSRIRDRFPERISPEEAQEKLRDRLFHGCLKDTRNSVRFLYANKTITYLDLLESCRKAEEEGKSSTVDNVATTAKTTQPKETPKDTKDVKLKAKAATTTPSSVSTEAMMKKIEVQETQIGQMLKQMESLTKAIQQQQQSLASNSTQSQSGRGRGRGRGGFPGMGRGFGRGRGNPAWTQQQPAAQQQIPSLFDQPIQELGSTKEYLPNQCYYCDQIGHRWRACPERLKAIGASSGNV